MSGVFNFAQPPRQLRDRRVRCRVRNYISARKVAFRRKDSQGPLVLAGWNLNHVPWTAANQQSVNAVRYQMYPCPRMFQTPLTDQVISPAAQRLYLLTTCNNLVDNYPRALLWVVRANLVLYPPASMPRYNLGVSRLWLRLRLSC